MPKEKIVRLEWWPDWYDGKAINESLFCQQFLSQYKLAYAEDAFFTRKGRLTDETRLKEVIFQMLKPFISTNVTRKITAIIELLKIMAYTDKLLPQPDRIHLANGTLFLNDRFDATMDEIVRFRLPVRYNPAAPAPVCWLNYLNQLLYPEDIASFQEFLGYSLIPSNKGQRMMVIKGNGGEGKSQIGAVLFRLLGSYAKDGSVGKVSENRFARADLEHMLLMIDDDMRIEALKQTNYVKSLVTAQGKMDLEKKGKQSYQGWMYARILAFSNGDLQSLYDRSDGFYRRQLILTTKEKPANRIDDPDLAEKMCSEIEGIFLWAFEGLKRLVANKFRFTESVRIKANREFVQQDGNSMISFMESEGYIRLDPVLSISSQELYSIYCIYCKENGLAPLKPRSMSEFLIANKKKFGIEDNNNQTNAAGRRVRGFSGIGAVLKLPMETVDHWQKAWPDDNPFDNKCTIPE